MSIIAKHDHADARLRCQDCNEAICPKCMVQCAVGARCKRCAGRFTSHVVQVTPAILIKTGLAALFVGFVYGCVQDSMAGFSFYSWLIIAAAGIGVGKLLHRVSSYKLGMKIAGVVLAGLIIGLILSPARDATLAYIANATAPQQVDPEQGSSMMSAMTTHLAGMILFVGCTVSQFLNINR